MTTSGFTSDARRENLGQRRQLVERLDGILGIEPGSGRASRSNLGARLGVGYESDAGHTCLAVAILPEVLQRPPPAFIRARPGREPTVVPAPPVPEPLPAARLPKPGPRATAALAEPLDLV